MRTRTLVGVVAGLFVVLVGRQLSAVQADRQSEAALAKVRAELEAVHAIRDAEAFGRLHTESTVFEWQGNPTPVVGRATMVANRRRVWAPRQDLRLVVRPSEVRIHSDRAYEFASYEESWTDAQQRRVTELGRLVISYVLESDGRWRVARTFGFTDSTSTE